MTVFLVGAGPGDPGLVTVRAASLLAEADVVVHDRLVDPAVLALCSPDALVIDVGKRPGGGEMAQRQINDLLVERGRGREVVVRLKGGDPYVFGRGGEEAEALERAGVDYEVVPGVSSIVAAPAAAGVPLTMRGVSSSFCVVTGHDADEPDGTVDWGALARSTATIVVVMGGASRRAVARRLVEGGRAPTTPVVVVESGTTPRQHTVRTTLAELATVAVANPATIVVGDVAALTFASYEARPLFGWRVVVTRAADRSRELTTALERAGAIPVEFPTIAIGPPLDGGTAVADALGRLSSFDWVVFSSANVVSSVFSHLRDARSLAPVRVAAIGPATAGALRERGVAADLVPERADAVGMLRELTDRAKGGAVLVPRSESGLAVLVDGLRQRGYRVESPDAYRIVRPVPPASALAVLDGADAVVFASPSALTGFLEIAGAERIPPVVAVIGPTTAAAARRAGIGVDAQAEVHTSTGVVEALSAFARERAARNRDRRPPPAESTP